MKLQMLKPRIQMAQPRIKTIQQTRNPEAEQRTRGRKWMDTRARWFADHPLCVMCQDMKPSRVTAAEVVDHIIPHKGDQTLFWDESNWQSLCKPHHDGEKAEQEGRHKARAKFDGDGRVLW